MIENMKSTIYESLPVVAGLNKIPGFDPRKFMRRAVSEQTKVEVLYLDLKYKKLWFRLACPKGRIKTTALKITEQLAIIEAKIFFDKNDKEPASSFIAQKNAKDTPGSLYIEAAQYAAIDQALIDAGFGLQFCDVSHGPDAELLDEGIPVSDAGKVQNTVTAEPSIQPAVPMREVTQQTVVRTEPVQPTADAQESQMQVQNQPAEAIVERITGQDNTPVITHIEAVQESRVVQPPVLDVPAEEITEEAAQDALPYTADMPVEDICRLMTLEEADSIIVDVGTCKGWTLDQVAQRRAASLKWYLNGYTGDNNILRAGAKLLLEREQEKMAS